MRNPFHDYSGFDDYVQKYKEIMDALYSGKLVVPCGKSVDVPANKYWYCKYHGCNVAPTKDDLESGNGENAFTEVWDGSLREYFKFSPASFKKDGSLRLRKKDNPEFDAQKKMWKYRCFKGNYQPLGDVYDFMELYCQYRQVSAGLVHSQRQIVIADFDESYQADTIQRLDGLCAEHYIPHYTYLERHLDSNHYQIGWILDKPIRLSDEHMFYKNSIVSIAGLFGSDVDFTGWNIKNPCCINLTDTTWFNDTVSKEKFCEALAFINADRFVQEQVEKAKIENERKRAEKALEKKANEASDTSDSVEDGKTADSTDDESAQMADPFLIENDEDFIDAEASRINDLANPFDINAPVVFKKKSNSRNKLLNESLRNWIWDYRRNNKEFPSMSLTLERAYEIGKEAGKITGKGSQDRSEIASVAKSVRYYAIKHFKDNNEQRDLGNLVKSVKAEYRRLYAYYLSENGKTDKEIAKIIEDKAEQSAGRWLSHRKKDGDSYIWYEPRLAYQLSCWMYFDNAERIQTQKVKNLIKLCEDTMDLYEMLFKDEIAKEIEAEALD